MARSEAALVYVNPALDRWRVRDFGAYRRVNDHWRTIAERDPEFKTVVMCIELVFGGDVVFRIAREPISTYSSLDGTIFEWSQGLVEEPDIEMSIQFGQQAASARSINLTLPSTVVGASNILARGGILAGIAEVSLTRDGDDYDQRLVLLRGDMAGGVTFGADGEALNVEISDPRLTASLKLPKYSVVLEAFPGALDSSIGGRYPVVINGYTRAPCLRVGAVRFLACAPGRDLEIVEVYVNGEVAAGIYVPWTEDDVRDDLGRPVKVVNFSGAIGPLLDTDSVYVELRAKTATRKISPVEIVQTILQGFTSLGQLGLNLELFSEAAIRYRGAPPSVLINASGAETVDCVDWVENTFLPSFPMIHMSYQGRGLGPVIIDRRPGADGDGIQGTFTGAQWPLIERLSGFDETPKAALYNVFEVRYAFNAMDNTYGGVVSRSPSNSRACGLCQSMIGGTRVFDTIDSPFITTKRQADDVIDWLVAHYAVPAYDVEWAVPASMIVRLRPGQNILYTDDKIAAFSNCRATILGFGYSRSSRKSSIHLRVWHPKWDQLLLGFA